MENTTNANLTGRVSRLPGFGRVNRNPTHRFQLKYKPWQIQPFMIAPVLPGETMKNLLLQARVVTDPIKNPLVGWHNEYMFFYVKLRDLNDRDAITAMLLDPSLDVSSLNTAAEAFTYHYGGAPNWTKMCLRRIVETEFRMQNPDGLTQEEAWDAYLIDNVPAAQISVESGLNSLQKKSLWDAANAADVSEDVDLDLNADGTITVTEAERARAQWEFLKASGLTHESYDRYLATYGIKPPPEVKTELHRPELIRYVREWSYPSNTVNPADGVPASAVSWSVAERADKDRFFKEPGFLFGVTLARPKVYLKGQKGSLASAMADALTWLPSALNPDAFSSVVEFAGNSGAGLSDAAGPIKISEDDYVFDIRDLLIYGDQFLNFDVSTAAMSIVDLPSGNLNRRYPTLTDVNSLFVTSGGNVRADGVVYLTIAGRQVDATRKQ